MNPAAFQAVVTPQPLAEPAQLDTRSFDQHIADQMTDVQTVDATAGDPGRLASPGALANEVMESLRGFLQRADAMHKTGWNRMAGLHAAYHASQSVAQLPPGPAQLKLEPASYQPQLNLAGEQSVSRGSDPRDYFSDVVKESMDEMSFYIQAEMLGHAARSLGHTANSLAKGQ